MKVSYQSSPKSTEPTVDQGQQLHYAKARRGGYRLRWYLLLAVVIAPAILVAWVLSKPLLFISAPGIITTEPLPIRAPQPGKISRLEVKIGESVMAGQNLAQISQPEIPAMIAQLEQRSLQLKGVSRDEEQATISQLQHKIQVAQQGLDTQSKLLKDFNKAMEQKLIPISDTIATVRFHTEAEMALEQAKIDLINEQKRQKQEQVSGPVARLKAEYELELTQLNAKAGQLNLNSPANTRVTQVEVQQGEYVSQDTTVMWLQGRDKPVVIAYLEPKYLDYANIGQQATIILPNGEKLEAQIQEPTELVSRLPKQLSGPFDGEKAVMKVVLTPTQPLAVDIEGMPVQVEFDYLWPASLQAAVGA